MFDEVPNFYAVVGVEELLQTHTHAHIELCEKASAYLKARYIFHIVGKYRIEIPALNLTPEQIDKKMYYLNQIVLKTDEYDYKWLVVPVFEGNYIALNYHALNDEEEKERIKHLVG